VKAISVGMTDKKFQKLLKIVTGEEFTLRQTEVFARVVYPRFLKTYNGEKIMNIKLRHCDCEADCELSS